MPDDGEYIGDIITVKSRLSNGTPPIILRLGKGHRWLAGHICRFVQRKAK